MIGTLSPSKFFLGVVGGQGQGTGTAAPPLFAFLWRRPCLFIHWCIYC